MDTLNLNIIIFNVELLQYILVVFKLDMVSVFTQMHLASQPCSLTEQLVNYWCNLFDPFVQE